MPWLIWPKREHQTRKELAVDDLYNLLEDETLTLEDRHKIIAMIADLEKAGPNKDRLSKKTIATLLVTAGVPILVIVLEVFGHAITSSAMRWSATPKPDLKEDNL